MPRDAVVTPTQASVIRELARDGASNRTIAQRLFISEDTVKTHMKNVLAATGCPHRTALVVALFRGEVRITARPRPALVDSAA